MGKGKLEKFAAMATYPHVFEHPCGSRLSDGSQSTAESFKMRGQWGTAFFGNNNPIVLELGCGRGEYTVGLARRFPEKNFIGIDIKGARMYTGATESLHDNLHNVAFLRTNIEIIEQFFGEGEVSEIWITFPDPQMKKHTKRLTSSSFLARYSKFLAPQGLIHLKTDSLFLYTYTKALIELNQLPLLTDIADLYSPTHQSATPPNDALTTIRTYYEQQWLERGIPIKYLRFTLPSLNRTAQVPCSTAQAPHSTTISSLDPTANNSQPVPSSLKEPDIEIELDAYRSYNRSKRSALDTHK